MSSLRNKMVIFAYRCISYGLVIGVLQLAAAPAQSMPAESRNESTTSAPSPSNNVSQKNNTDSSDLEASVVVLNRKITVFRAPFLGVSPASRVKRSEAAIKDLLDRGDQGTVTVNKVPQGSVLLIDGQLALILIPDDADALRGETLDTITKSAVTALDQVIQETKEGRDKSRLLRSFGLCAVATFIFILVVGTMQHVRKWLSVRLANLFKSSVAKMQVGGTEFFTTNKLLLTRVTRLAFCPGPSF